MAGKSDEFARSDADVAKLASNVNRLRRAIITSCELTSSVAPSSRHLLLKEKALRRLPLEGKLSPAGD